MTTSSRKRWTCPECERVFKIPASAPEPTACPECRAVDWNPAISPPQRPAKRGRGGVSAIVVSLVLLVLGVAALLFGLLYLIALRQRGGGTVFQELSVIGAFILAAVGIGLGQVVRLLADG